MYKIIRQHNRKCLPQGKLKGLQWVYITMFFIDYFYSYHNDRIKTGKYHLIKQMCTLLLSLFKTWARKVCNLLKVVPSHNVESLHMCLLDQRDGSRVKTFTQFQFPKNSMNKEKYFWKSLVIVCWEIKFVISILITLDPCALWTLYELFVLCSGGCSNNPGLRIT